MDSIHDRLPEDLRNGFRQFPPTHFGTLEQAAQTADDNCLAAQDEELMEALATSSDLRSAIPSIPKFQYTRMHNNEGQIRLLSFKPSSTSIVFDCELHIYHLDQSPAYCAVSYTWGRQQRAPAMLIANQVLDVGQNCRYALQQIFRRMSMFGGLKYVWIDSICIDQNHIPEKSAQVQIMGDIFSRAQYVLASVGPHLDDSRFLYDVMHEYIKSHFNPFGLDSYGQHTSTESIKAILIRISWAFLRVCARHYWLRTWIVPEILLARCIYILCGNDVISWADMQEFYDFLTAEMLFEPDILMALHDIPLARLDPPFIHDESLKRWSGGNGIIQRYAHTKCSDARDHIYAFLPLADWPAVLEPLKADYSKPEFQLVIDILHAFCIESYMHVEPIEPRSGVKPTRKGEHSLFESTLALLDALKVNQTHPLLVDMIQDRIEGTSSLRNFRRRHFQGDMPRTSMRKIKIAPSRASRIYANAHGQLTTDALLWSMDDCPRLAQRMDSIILKVSSNFAKWTYKTIFVGSDAAAWTCPGTRDGDILVSVFDSGKWVDTELCMVVRNTSHNVCKIVGQAFMNRGYALRASLSTDVDQVPCRINLFFDLSDFLVFVAQSTRVEEIANQSTGGQSSNRKPKGLDQKHNNICPVQDSEIEEAKSLLDRLNVAVTKTRLSSYAYLWTEGKARNGLPAHIDERG